MVILCRRLATKNTKDTKNVLELNCDRCHRELKQPGALIFSPPTTATLLVEKYHICIDCWPTVATLIKNRNFDDNRKKI